jgi:hypothetical protein
VPLERAGVSTIYVVLTTIISGVAVATFICDWSKWVSFLNIAVINVLIFWVLISFARLSDMTSTADQSPLINTMPYRLVALLIFPFLIGSAILYFASIYYTHAYQFSNTSVIPFDALHFSFQTFTALDSDILTPKTEFVKGISILEVITSINVFIGGISLLLSRMTNV